MSTTDFPVVVYTIGDNKNSSHYGLIDNDRISSFYYLIGDLIKENFIIKDNDTQKDYSEYFTISTTTMNGKTSTKLIPSYNIKNLFTAGKDHVDINIVLSDSITDDEGYSITGTKSWYYRVVNHAEEIEPVIDEIHLYSDSDPNAYFYRELTQKQKGIEWSEDFEVDEEVQSTILQFGDYSRNHVSKIYICVQAHDEGSGIDYLRVKEKQNNDVAIREYTDDIAISDVALL